MSEKTSHIVIIGAGMGGLATAIRVASAGYGVTLLEAADGPGGKMRTVRSAAGPVDAGPTVVTMRHQFDDLFKLAHEDIEDHVTLEAEPLLARHWWPDGSSLDLFGDAGASRDAIASFAGAREAAAFEAFSARAARLFNAFEAPMMEAPAPSLGSMTAAVLRQPSIIPDMGALRSLAGELKRTFRDARLRQLFGRYSTYVGGHPAQSPAILQLIWHAEASGVWRVQGGMARLAEALAGLAERMGVDLRYGAPVERIEMQDGRAAAVHAGGQRFQAEAVVFNGDPAALRAGLLGSSARFAVPEAAVEPRSLSARVWAFAAEASGVELAHHNVFFGWDPASEFGEIKAGRAPIDPTLYVCAQDRGTGVTAPALERFEIIENAAPGVDVAKEEKQQCRTRVFEHLAERGLVFTPRPDTPALTVPGEFHRLFPASQGSLYGLSPHGMMAAFKRPTARTALPGLYLAGGGAHPGAGIAMATLSGKHAAGAILKDLASPSTSPKTDTRGGTLTESRMTGLKPSRS